MPPSAEFVKSQVKGRKYVQELINCRKSVAKPKNL